MSKYPVSPKMSNTVILTLFGNGVSEAVIKLGTRWFRQVLTQYNGYCHEKWTDTYPRRQHTTWPQRVRLTCSRHAGEGLLLPANHQKLERGKEGFSPTGVRGSIANQSLDFRPLAPEWEDRKTVLLSSLFVVLCYSSPRKLIQGSSLPFFFLPAGLHEN